MYLVAILTPQWQHSRRICIHTSLSFSHTSASPISKQETTLNNKNPPSTQSSISMSIRQINKLGHVYTQLQLLFSHFSACYQNLLKQAKRFIHKSNITPSSVSLILGSPLHILFTAFSPADGAPHYCIHFITNVQYFWLACKAASSKKTRSIWEKVERIDYNMKSKHIPKRYWKEYLTNTSVDAKTLHSF